MFKYKCKFLRWYLYWVYSETRLFSEYSSDYLFFVLLIKKYPYYFMYVPKEFHTFETCCDAINYSHRMIHYIRDEELLIKLLIRFKNVDELLVSDIEPENLTFDILKTAIDIDIDNKWYIRRCEKLNNDEIARLRAL